MTGSFIESDPRECNEHPTKYLVGCLILWGIIYLVTLDFASRTSLADDFTCRLVSPVSGKGETVEDAGANTI